MFLLGGIALILFVGIVAGLYVSSLNRQKEQKEKIATLRKNQDYVIELLKDIQDVSGYGSNLGIVIDVITKSIEGKFPYSTLSSMYMAGEKIIFKSQVKETVSRAFINHIKNTMIDALSLLPEPPQVPKENEQDTQNLSPDIITEPASLKVGLGKSLLDTVEENVTGVALDELATSEIKSSLDIKIAINTKTQAIINISSVHEDIYTDEDRRSFSAISTLVSDFRTRLDVLIGLEKSKSLAMIDSFTDGIFMIDRDGVLIAMNNAAIDFLHIDTKNPTFNDALASLPNTYNFKDKIDRVMAKSERIEESDVSINNKIFKVIITPVLEINIPGKNIIGASVLLKDITLEKSIAQLKDDFTNVMVHELRSPLTAIKASTEFLMSQADLSDDEKKHLIEMISESSHKMLDKIGLILDSAKLDAGLFTLRKTQSDLKKLIADRIATFTPVAQEKSIHLKVDVDPTIPLFAFDAIRVDEVINNLLSNSLKFTPENGSITLQAMLSPDKVLVSVSDTGVGIAKDKQGKLFAKYQQAPSSGQHVGTGLGLYVVKQIVEDHGGTVSLVSDEGKGTTITFSLPLRPSMTLSKPGTPPTNPPQKLVN